MLCLTANNSCDKEMQMEGSFEGGKIHIICFSCAEYNAFFMKGKETTTEKAP